MILICGEKESPLVALLAEGVDRNEFPGRGMPLGVVALLAEGVDRNLMGAADALEDVRRPPRGGRG